MIYYYYYFKFNFFFFHILGILGIEYEMLTPIPCLEAVQYFSPRNQTNR